MTILKTVAELEAIYGEPSEASLIKVSDRPTQGYRKLVKASALAAELPTPVSPMRELNQDFDSRSCDREWSDRARSSM
ncbi:MAG: hypothetical protein ACSHXI_05485 [Hoeflea sp.]|uniref:hypothetical protein n=1 Tax=Hoeflea sp. TaxID=1940281 RepID=UPI003EF9C80D